MANTNTPEKKLHLTMDSLLNEIETTLGLNTKIVKTAKSGEEATCSLFSPTGIKMFEFIVICSTSSTTGGAPAWCVGGTGDLSSMYKFGR